MVSDERADQLAEVAAQLAARVRDDDPAAVGRWLRAVAPTADDWWALLFVLAAAVPTDVPFNYLTAWTRLDREVDPVIAQRRDILNAAMAPARNPTPQFTQPTEEAA